MLPAVAQLSQYGGSWLCTGLQACVVHTVQEQALMAPDPFVAVFCTSTLG